MKCANYFDIETEELNNIDIKEFLVTLYQKIEAPKGQVYSWRLLPHEEKGMNRIYAVYEIKTDIR